MSSSFVQEYSGGLTVSVIGHVLIALLFSFNLADLVFRDDPAVRLPIEATVIDMSAVREKQEAERRRLQEIERQQKAAAEERRRKEAEQKRVAEQKKQQAAEQKRIAEDKRRKEAEQKRIAEQKRKAEAERQRVAEEKRRKEEAERKRIAEQKRREEEARLVEQRRKEEMERLFQSEIEAEEERLAAISSGKLSEYKAAIIARVTRNWVKPASARAGIECEVSVTQIPGGEIVNVRVGRCNGDAAVIRSIEAAVYRSSPLPPPPDPSLFDRNLRFTFKPEE